MWLNHSEAINRIVRLSQRDLSTQQTKKELFSILSVTDKWEYDKVVTWVANSYKNAKWYDEKKRLQVVSPMVASYTAENGWEGKADKKETGRKPWVVTLIREKDSTWKYKVYKYQVKNRWYLKHLIKEYTRQTKWDCEWVKITNSKWKEYPKDKKFSAWDIVYIKAPITSLERVNEKTKEKIKIQEDYINEQISWNVVWAKITDSRWVEYKKDKKFSVWDTVYIKLGIWSNKRKKYEVKKWWTVKDIINEYIVEYKEQQKSYKNMLENFNKQYPMWKDIELSFGIPVWHYEDIEKTLTSITTNQKIDPKRYEVVFLLNRPNDTENFDKKVKEKILTFKQKHPEYNICIFEKTFDFKKNKEGKREVNYWELYKTLADTIVYRNVQRENIKWMDVKKIRNLIVKTWAADSTDKNPKYIENQFEKYNMSPSDKELVSMRWESRLPVDVCKKFPLIETLEFFQRNFDNEYAGWAINRNVWIWSYKSRIYCDAGWFNTNYFQWEDVQLWKDIKRSIRNRNDATMYYDDKFVWAVDESCDRWIWAMVENKQPYCDRYNDREWNMKSKEKNWNRYAIEHRREKEFEVLKLTRENLEKNLSAFYRQRLNNIFIKKTSSNKYNKYLEWEWKNATPQERAERIAKNVVNPIMEKILSRDDLMGLSKSDYSFWPITVVEYHDEDGKSKWFRLKSAELRFSESAITKIEAIQDKKIKNWYYNYR